MERQYRVNDVFFSLQGEGVRVGAPNIFLRLSGCNQTCRVETHGFDCDTEFVSGVSLTAIEIIQRLHECAPHCRSIIITGGEPLLQLDAPLCDALKNAGYFLAIETNGSIEPTQEVRKALDWVYCSPKVAEHAVRLTSCDELKYVRAYGQGIPKPALSNATFRLVSPAAEGDHIEPKTLKWCIDLVKANPEWRLTMQYHKVWRVR